MNRSYTVYALLMLVWTGGCESEKGEPAPSPTAPEAVDWQQFTSREGGFSVLLPGEPQRETTSAGTVMETITFRCQGDAMEFKVSYHDLDNYYPNVYVPQGTLLSWPGEHPAREKYSHLEPDPDHPARHNSMPPTVRSRTVGRQGRTYTVEVVITYPDDWTQEWQAERQALEKKFFDSFRFEEVPLPHFPVTYEEAEAQRLQAAAEIQQRKEQERQRKEEEFLTRNPEYRDREQRQQFLERADQILAKHKQSLLPADFLPLQQLEIYVDFARRSAAANPRLQKPLPSVALLELMDQSLTRYLALRGTYMSQGTPDYQQKLQDFQQKLREEGPGNLAEAIVAARRPDSRPDAELLEQLLRDPVLTVQACRLCRFYLDLREVRKKLEVKPAEQQTQLPQALARWGEASDWERAALMKPEEQTRFLADPKSWMDEVFAASQDQDQVTQERLSNQALFVRVRLHLQGWLPLD